MSKERLFLSPPDMSGRELEYVKQAFESNYIAPLGPMLDKFEKVFCEYLDINHCVGLSSGTAAMHLILRHLGVGKGDTVFASTLTFIGSISPITFQGAEPVFIDCDRKSWNMDPNLLATAIAEADQAGRLPEAVIPTDLYGQCADLDAIQAVCEPYGIPVIVDAAESLGAEYKGRKSGKGAYASVYSFNGNKIITTSGGGMLATEDKALADHARKLATQARDDAPHYEHSEIGYNYRMSNIVAAIGLGQMEIIDERVERKREIFAAYESLLGDVPGIEFMPEDGGQGTEDGRLRTEDGGRKTEDGEQGTEDGRLITDDCELMTEDGEQGRSRHNRWLTVITLDPDKCKSSPEEVRLALERENIEARPVWKPMHCQPVFEGCKVFRRRQGYAGQDGGGVAEELFARGLCLPSGTAMTDQDIERVAGLIKKETA